MLNVLPESRRVRRRATTSLALSAAVHLGLVAAALEARTVEPARPRPDVTDTVLYFQSPRPVPRAPARPTTPTPEPTVPRPDDAVLPPLPAPPPADGTAIPDGVPPVDVRLGDVFSRDTTRVNVIGRPAGPAGAPVGETPLPNSVADKPALALPDNPTPRYPEMLRAAGVSGSVTMRFVIDSAGRVSARAAEVKHSDHDLFTAAVRAVLPRLRFVPAEANGRKVRVLAEQRFEFRLER